MIRLQRWENGPYPATFSLGIPAMRRFVQMREFVKICPRSPMVLIEPVFLYRTPKSGRLLVEVVLVGCFHSCLILADHISLEQISKVLIERLHAETSTCLD
jgi:hypothetical protein